MTNTAMITVSKIKARANYHVSHVTMLCPNGHVVAQVQLNGQSGSYAQAELTARVHGQSNVYDRLAQLCAVQDATERH